MLGQRPEVFDLHPRQTDAFESSGIHGKQLGGRRHSPGEALAETSGNGPNSKSRNLLADDRIDEHAKGIVHRLRFAPDLEIDGFSRIDEPRDLSVTGLQRGQRSIAM